MANTGFLNSGADICSITISDCSFLLKLNDEQGKTLTAVWIVCCFGNEQGRNLWHSNCRVRMQGRSSYWAFWHASTRPSSSWSSALADPRKGNFSATVPKCGRCCQISCVFLVIRCLCLYSAYPSLLIPSAFSGSLSFSNKHAILNMPLPCFGREANRPSCWGISCKPGGFFPWDASKSVVYWENEVAISYWAVQNVLLLSSHTESTKTPWVHAPCSQWLWDMRLVLLESWLPIWLHGSVFFWITFLCPPTTNKTKLWILHSESTRGIDFLVTSSGERYLGAWRCGNL